MIQINWDKIHEVLAGEAKPIERKEHFLKRTKHMPRTPLRVVYFDSESQVDKVTLKHNPYIICATFAEYRHEEPRKIKRRYVANQYADKAPGVPTLSEFWQDVSSFTLERQVCWLFAHNMGYDILATAGAPNLFRRGFVPLGHPYEKGSTFIWEMAKKNTKRRHCEKCSKDKPCKRCKRIPIHVNRLRFISTTNYFQQSLAKLGDVFGVKKTNQEANDKFDFDKLYTYPIEKVFKYCDRDVEIIVNAMETLFKACDEGAQTGFGSFKMTIPSMAFSSYLTWFVPEDTLHIHTDDTLIALERASYCGGRTEVWKRRIVRDRLFQVDINSMYPHVMKAEKYPTRCISRKKHLPSEAVRTLLNDRGYCLTAKCRLKTDKPVYPLKWDNKLVFPTGEFVTTLSTPEIKYALEHGHILEIIDLAVYKSGYIFREFVETFYNKRQAAKESGETVWDQLYKLNMNSLYGKFGQERRDWFEVGECDAELVKTEDVIEDQTHHKLRLRYFGGRVFVEEPNTSVAHHSCVAIAAHVTAYARMLLWEYIETVGIEHHFYNDTDSLFVDQIGFDRLVSAGVIDDYRLGALALEKTIEQAYFRRPKDYIIDGVRKCKGVNKEALKRFGTEFDTTQWPTFRSAVNQGNIEGFANKTVKKKMKYSYSKGWVAENGDILPLVFGVIDGENVCLRWEDTGYEGELKARVNDEMLGVV